MVYQYSTKLTRKPIKACESISPSATCSLAAYEFLKAYGLTTKPNENFVVLMLSVKNEVVGVDTVSVGSINATSAGPREVFRSAIITNAAAIIVAHNHPSGNVNPSEDDKELTIRLCEAGRILGIPVVDHLIVSMDGYYSFREKGEL